MDIGKQAEALSFSARCFIFCSQRSQGTKRISSPLFIRYNSVGTWYKTERTDCWENHAILLSRHFFFVMTDMEAQISMATLQKPFTSHGHELKYTGTPIIALVHML